MLQKQDLSKRYCEDLISKYEPSREGKAKLMLGIDGMSCWSSQSSSHVCMCTSLPASANIYTLWVLLMLSEEYRCPSCLCYKLSRNAVTTNFEYHIKAAKKYKLIPIHTQRQLTKLFCVSLKSPEEIKAAIDSHRESRMVAKR